MNTPQPQSRPGKNNDLNVSMRTQIQRVIIDEGVGETEWRAVLRWAALDTSDIPRLFLTEAHPGIPDRDILLQLMNTETALITKDQELHNTALLMEYVSYYCGNDEITAAWLQGVSPKDYRKILVKQNRVLKADYIVPQTDFRAALLPQDEGQLRKLHVRRRRIRSYCQGLDNIREIAVAVSQRRASKRVIVGFAVRAIPHTLPALDASESFIRDSSQLGSQGLMAASYALIGVHRLSLHGQPVHLYLDGHCFPDELLTEKPPHTALERFFHELVEHFSDLHIAYPRKGWNMENLRQKIQAVSQDQRGNQIKAGDLSEIIARYDTLKKREGAGPRDQQSV